MFLVTGCGKSATGWAAELFRQLGWDCTHEGQFNLDQHGPLVKPEVSWLAVPYLDQVPAAATVVHVVRNPYHVVQSAWRMSLFRRRDRANRTRYEQFIVDNLPRVQADDRLSEIIRWVAWWDQNVPEYASRVLRPDLDGPLAIHNTVEWLTDSRLQLRRVSSVIAKLGRVHASPKGRTAPSQRDINRHPEGYLIQRRAKEWGYT